MNADPSVVILIPARNEEATVGDVVRDAVAQLGFEVVVIDDSSSDRTIEVALAAGATVLPLPLHLGAWGAIQTGFRYAMQCGYRIAVTMDADRQHPVSSVPSLLDPLRNEEADVVVGSCVQRATSARHLAWKFFRLVSMIGVKDLTSGFRAYNYAAMVLLASRRAALLDYQDVGVLILLNKAGLRVVETEVQMLPRRIGNSKVFSSWSMIANYMLRSSILCLAKRRYFGAKPLP